MDYPETLVTLDTQDTGWRKQNKKKHKTGNEPRRSTTYLSIFINPLVLQWILCAHPFLPI